MSGTPNSVSSSAPARPVGAGVGRRAARRAETRAEIVAAAWEVVREQGLAALSMRDLGARVGMKAQSLYSYVGSKDEIYDAMFRQGYEEFLAAMDAAPFDGDDRDDAVAMAVDASRRFFAFCTSDPVRYQLLFQRTIPGFEPSPESYAVAVAALTRMQTHLARFGITEPAALDLWTAVLTGLTDQQISNDPGGDRWERLVERAVHMLFAEVAPHVLDGRPPRRQSTRTAATTPSKTTPKAKGGS